MCERLGDAHRQVRERGERLLALVAAQEAELTSALLDVRGLTENLPPNVTVTGGLSGDGTHFKETAVLWDGVPEQGTIAAMGFYGEHLKVGYASLGGWDPFGPERVATRSKGNVLFELDGLQAYNEAVAQYNTARSRFPTSLIAATFGFVPAEPFRLETTPGKPGTKDLLP